MKYKKKPVIIDAIQWTGDNVSEVLDFVGHLDIQMSNHDVDGIMKTELYINTLEGVMHASVDDWIIKGIRGEFYPCKPDVFKETYDPVE